MTVRRLLQPSRRQRGPAGDVAFHQEHLDRLKFIKRALAWGFTLDDISELTNPNAPADVWRCLRSYATPD